MKRFLSLLLVIVMVFSMIPQAAFAEEVTFEFGETELKSGDNVIKLVDGFTYTLNEYAPTEAGVYTFTAPEGAKLADFNTQFFTFLKTETPTNTLVWSCSEVGQTLLLGVSAEDKSVNVNIARTGDIHKDPDPVPYVNKHTPNKANILDAAKYCHTVEAVDANDVVNFTASDLVLNGEFYYVNGNPVYVNFVNEKLKLTAALENPGMKYYEYDASGNITAITDYRAALCAYVGADPTSLTVNPQWTKYPLTTDLFTILSNLDAKEVWTGGPFIPKGWIELCYMIVVDHTPGDRVVSGDTYTISCTKCKDVLETGTVETEPACEHEYFYACDAHCMHCGELTNENAAHTIDHVEATKATCEAVGNVEYWTCTDCGACWLDEALTQTTNRMSIIVPSAHTAGEAVEEVNFEDNCIYSVVSCTICSTQISSEKLYESGETAENPTDLTSDLLYEDDFSATVTVPAGKTYHFAAYRVGGMTMTINGGEGVECVTEGMWNPYIWTITNDSEAATEYVIKVSYPVGTQMNPEIIETMDYTWTEVSLAEGDPDGYYYTYTAEGDGFVNFWFGYNEEAPEADIVVTNTNTGAQRTLLEDGVDNYGLELQMEVSAGDVLAIQVLVVPDDNWNVVAANLEWYGDYVAVPGSAANPIYIEWEWNDRGSEATATVEVEAGATVYYFAMDGMIMTVNGEVFAVEDMSFALTNDGEETATYELVISYPIGSADNPAQMVIGENTADIAAATWGYYFGWTATEDSELTITMSEGKDWLYQVSKNPVDPEDWSGYYYGEEHRSDDETVVSSESISVSAGETIVVMVNTIVPGEMWVDAPAGTVSFTASVKAVCKHEYFNACDAHCMLCGELTNEDAAHSIKHVKAVEATCQKMGNVEYWTCEYCGSCWLDEALTQVTNSRNVVTFKNHEYFNACDAHCMLCGELTNEDAAHDVEHVDAHKPTGAKEGNIEYWYCKICGQAWLDAECTLNTNLQAVILPATGECDHENVQHRERIEPGCHYNGQIEYWFCADCETWWLDADCTLNTNSKSVVLPYTGSENLQHVEAVAATCFKNGNIEHWYCPDCEQFWQDKALTQLTNAKNIIVPMAHAELTHVEAKEATCFEDGNIEYWYCADCGYAWLDAEGTLNTNLKAVVLSKAHAELTHVEAKEATCYEVGNIEYWYCESCGYAWLDAEGTLNTNQKSVVLPIVHDVQHVEEKKPACHYNGTIEYWYCTKCGTAWQDESQSVESLTNLKNVIVPATGSENVVHFDAVAPGCHSNGNVEYWFCPDCEQFWQDEAMTQITTSKSVILPATGSENVVHFDAVAPGCHSNGNVEYWFCPDCEGFWTNEACTELTNSKNVILPATGSENVVHFDAVEPGCHSNGNVEYWFCPDCEGFWMDEACTKVTNSKSVILPAVGGDVKHVEAKESTCEQEGNIEYWYCLNEECNKVWQDEALTQLTNHKNVITPKKDHTPVDGIKFTISEKQSKSAGDYIAICEFTCAECGQKITETAEVTYKVVQDATCSEPGTGVISAKIELNGKVYEAAASEKKEIEIAAEHEVIHIEAVAPGCHFEGVQEHWYCTGCDIVWTDAAKTQISNHKNVIIPALGGDVTHVKAVKATCIKEGNIEHWYCDECEKVWQDEALTQLTNHKNVILPIDDKAHTSEWIQTKAPTCDEKDGKGEKVLKCTLCNKVLEKKEIAKLDHKFAWVQTKDPTCYAKGEKVKQCEVCDHIAEKKDVAMTKHVDKNKDNECDVKECKADLTNQKTGDMIMIAVVVMVLAAAAIVVLLNKKRRSE